MKKLNIAFFKSTHGNYQDKIIDLGSGADGYSHCEIVIDAQTSIGAHYEQNGVIEYRYNNIYDLDCWDIIELPIKGSPAKVKAVQMVGTPYDLRGVILYYFKLKFGASNKAVWCSEMCALCINESEKILDDTLIMPNDLFNILKNHGGSKIVKTNSKKKNKNTKNPIIDRFGRISYEQ